MTRCERTSGPGGAPAGRRRSRAGAVALGALAGAAALSGGTAAVALAAAHTDPAVAATAPCVPLPQPQPTPSGSASGGPPVTPASTPAGETELCLSVQPQAATATPGQNALYQVHVWATGGTASGVSVRIALATSQPKPAFPLPTFSYCGDGAGTQACSVGSLDPAQTSELQGEVAVPHGTTSGDVATLTATASAAVTDMGTASVADSAAIKIIATAPTSPHPQHSSGTTKHHGTSSGATEPELAKLPALDQPGSTQATPDPGNLFPTIGPAPGSPTPSPARSTPPAAARAYHPTAAADVLPLNQISGQLAGLAVLALAVGLTVTRISLRRPQPPRGGDPPA